MITLNDFKRQWRDISQDAIAAFNATGESGWYILGNEVKEFERDLAAFWRVSYAVGVASGLDAIEIGLRCLGCKAGDKVLTTPVSAFATTLAIVKIGAVPVFVDTDSAGLVDLEAAKEVFGDDNPPRYFVPVHLFGHSLDLRALASFQNEFGVQVLEDCAQSIGADFAGVPTGTVGRIAATSFYPTKNLGALGDAGALLTSEEEYTGCARMLRDYGQTAKYQHDTIGMNSRLDELQASFLRRVSLPRLGEWTARRREIADAYKAGIRNPAVQLPLPPRESNSCWHLFPVLVAPELRATFTAHLKLHGVSTAEHYPIAIPDQPALSKVPFEIAEPGIAKARHFCRSEVSLPIHPYLSGPEVEQVIEAVNKWNA